MDEYKRWAEYAVDDPDLTAELTALEASGDNEGIRDRFYRDLEFGTGGLRGLIGAGSNRMNIYTVRRATQGLANYLLKSGDPLRVAIAYDSRIKSELFAREAARVLASNNIEALIFPRLMPTPALSFAVRHLSCGAGICVTASHNPAGYNGYKVYGSDGCQITTEAANGIYAEIQQIDPFDSVKYTKYETNGKTSAIAEETVDAFLNAVLAQRVDTGCYAPLKIVYTPLHGAGLECVTRVLKSAGYNDVTTVASQTNPDGNFPTCKVPNPEERDAMGEGLRLCEELAPDLLLATDPDCDRVGIAAPDCGGYVLFTGNEIGILLLDYICSRREALGSMPENPVAIKTIVTTALADKIAGAYGVKILNTLTGFKFIGEQIGILEQAGQTGRYIFGFEESYGYLSGSHVRDKDGVNASLLICDMAAWHKSNGLTLPQALTRLYEHYGYCLNSLDTFSFSGEQGLNDMQDVMHRLRKSPPADICGYRVRETNDYLWREGEAHDCGHLPSSDVLQWFLEEQTVITIRPSGTEPKLKTYLSVTRNTKNETRQALLEFREYMPSLIF